MLINLESQSQGISNNYRMNLKKKSLKKLEKWQQETVKKLKN